MNPLLVLLRLARYSSRYFATCVLFSTLVMFWIPLPLGLLSRAFFDSISGNQPAGLNTWSILALVVALQVTEVWIDPLLRNPWNALQQNSYVLLQRNLFAAILRGFGRCGLPVSIGEAISRFRDDPNVMGDGLDALCDLIGRSLFAAVALVVMWRVNPLMTGVLCVPLVLSAWLAEALGTRTMAYRAASQAATSRVTGFLGEVIGAQLAVSVGGATPSVVAHLRELGDARRRMAVRDRVFNVLLDSFSVNLGNLGTGLVLLIGARAIADGTFSVGDFALFVLYLDQLIWYPAEIARLISDLKRIRVSYSRMHAIVPTAAVETLVAPRQPPPPDVEYPPLECLEVRGLGYAHPGGLHGIDDVSFVLRRGSFTVITGRIGSGKSTLLHVLLGLLPRDGGDVYWNGQPVADLGRLCVPPRCAFTPQVPRLFSETLRDNIVLGREVTAAALDGAVRAAVLEPDVAGFAAGLETLVGPRGVKLSGGQVQRVAAARMFVADAEVLVLDDVSSALDAATETELWARLGARPDVTCLVVSHRPAALARADQVLFMEHGRLAGAR